MAPRQSTQSTRAFEQATINGQPERMPPSPKKTLQSIKEISRSVVERRRRNDMGGLLATLQALLPKALKKRGRSSQCSILTETINYIAALQEQREELARKKANFIASKGAGVGCAHNRSTGGGNALTGKEAPNSLLPGSKVASIKREGWSKVEVSPAQTDIFITISTSDRTGLLSGALLSLQNFDLDVLSACLSTNAQLGFLSIHCQVSPGAGKPDIGKLRDELQQLVVGGEAKMKDHKGRGGEVSNSDLENENYPSAKAISSICHVLEEEEEEEHADVDEVEEACGVDSRDGSEFEAILDYKIW